MAWTAKDESDFIAMKRRRSEARDLVIRGIASILDDLLGEDADVCEEIATVLVDNRAQIVRALCEEGFET